MRFKQLLNQLSTIKDRYLNQPAPIEIEEELPSPPSPATAKLMQRIKNSRALLSVTIAGSEDRYLSAILDVNEEEGYIVLDELNSPAANRSLARVKRMQINTRLENRDISFACEVTGIGEDRGIPYYKIPFPVDLSHQLRRRFLRINTPRGKYLPVHLETENDDLATGQLIDLSTGGFGALMNREGSDKIQRGDFIPNCKLYLGDNNPVETTVEIRYCEDKQYSKTPRLGGMFVDLTQNDERRLQRYITHLDRVKARHQVQQ
jgi:c-di-GMP-binding flagellar brake protein YcgR